MGGTVEMATSPTSFNNINNHIKNIEDGVDGIMKKSKVAVVESKKPYEKKITELGV